MRERAFLELLGDEHILKMLEALENGENTTNGISEECSIPLSTCYRKIEKLKAVGFVGEVDERKAAHGRRTKLYSSRVRKLELVYRSGRVLVQVTYRSGRVVARELDTLFQIDHELETHNSPFENPT